MKKNQTGTNSENLLALRPNKRQGDWVCVLCNNLNYSFRDTCNRCKNMTREENSTFIKSQKKDRNPLGELVFNRHSSQKQQIQNSLTQDACMFNSQNSRKYKALQPSAAPQEFNYTEPRKPLLGLATMQSKGFSSLLFLTPTRYLKLNEEEEDKEHSQKDPRSPCIMPSVSPLLRALKDQINAGV